MLGPPDLCSTANLDNLERVRGRADREDGADRTDLGSGFELDSSRGMTATAGSTARRLRGGAPCTDAEAIASGTVPGGDEASVREPPILSDRWDVCRDGP